MMRIVAILMPAAAPVLRLFCFVEVEVTLSAVSAREVSSDGAGVVVDCAMASCVLIVCDPEVLELVLDAEGVGVESVKTLCVGCTAPACPSHT